MRPISSFSDDPSEAGRELLPCLDEAKDTVPYHQQETTPVFLGATAGMRLLRYACQIIHEIFLLSFNFEIFVLL